MSQTSTAQIANRNAILAYAINGFENASATLPIWILFLTRQLRFSVTAAIVLMMTRWGTMALSNIPTGAWADRFGRAKLYRIGQFFYALSFIPFLFVRNYEILFLIQIIGGFFGAMSIGVLQPLVQDSYVLAKRPSNKYTKYLSTETVILYASRLVAGIVGAWLYSKHPFAPYGMDVIVLMCAFVCSLWLKEVRVEKSYAASNREHIRDALSYVWLHKYLRNFIFSAIIVALATESLWTGLQPYFVFRGIGSQYFGLLFGIVALFSMAGAFYSRKILDNIDGLRIILFMGTISFAGSLLMLISGQWIVLLAMLMLGLAFGFTSPVASYNIQKHTGSKHQSTVLSLYSLLYTGIYVVASVLVGRYVDLFGTGTMLKILAVQAFICFLIVTSIKIYIQNISSVPQNN